jgi:hypothetical protein
MLYPLSYEGGVETLAAIVRLSARMAMACPIR